MYNPLATVICRRTQLKDAISTADRACREAKVSQSKAKCSHHVADTTEYKVRGFGTRVALDDFGAGLHLVRRHQGALPADLRKIDGSFIVNLSLEASDASRRKVH